MHLSLAEIMSLIIQHRYLILFPLLVVEGPIVTIIAAFLASPAGGTLSLPLLFIEVVAADLTGDIFYYSIGRWGREGFLFRLTQKVGLTRERFQKVEGYFDKHGGKTIALSKIGHGLGWPAMMAAGAARMRFLKFFFINLSVSILKSGFLIFLGYYYGRSYSTLSAYVHYGGVILSVLLLGGLVAYFLLRKKKTGIIEL